MARRGAIARGLTALGRIYPLKSGYSRVSELGPVRRAIEDHEEHRAKLRSGDVLFVRTDDFIGRIIYLFGDFDAKITWVCDEVLRPGDVVLDIGANLGSVSTYAAAAVGPTGSVHAFEPQPELADMMRRSAQANGHDQITVHEVALSDADGELPLYGHRAIRGRASLEADPEVTGTDLLTVAAVRESSAFLGELDLGHVRLVKIDVEGHEEQVLTSAAEFLRSDRPDVIVFESHGTSPFFERPVVELLDGIGYSFFHVPRATLRMRLEPMTPQTPLDAASFDYVAVQDGVDWPPARVVRSRA